MVEAPESRLAIRSPFRDMPKHPFQTELDADQYFQGLARQEMDFQDALGELIDNAFSARLPVEFGEGLQPMAVEVTLEKMDGETVEVQVADHGVGMTLSDVTDRVFNPGGQGSQRGALNEHGFGLKNALALLTGGNSSNFDLYTRSADDESVTGDRFLHVTGPLSTEMVVRDDAGRKEWETNLHHLQLATTGTKVCVLVRWKYFRSVYRRGDSGLDVLAKRLGEHLGVMHRYFLKEGNSIKLAYRQKGGEWTHKTVQAIDVPFEGESKTVTRNFTLDDGSKYTFEYSYGMADYSVKDHEAEAEKGWPYPLRSYYQGSNARCGVDIVVRGRVIKSGVFEAIWPDIPKTVEFNRFVGELRVGSDFRTTNNKTGLDPHADNWERLLSDLDVPEFRPEKTTKSDSETSLRKKLGLILSGTFAHAKVTKDRAVWGGGIEIDIFVEVDEKNIRVYELKVTNGRVVDLYQLLAGWDGLVKEGIKPTIGVLVCKSYSQQLAEAVEAANGRSDGAGNRYQIELRRIDEVIPAN
jgi:hypothetical protein